MATEKHDELPNDKPALSVLSPLSLIMPKTVHHVKSYAKAWDSDKALKSTHNGPVGKYQLRAYLLFVLGYAVVAAWLTAMPTFALLPPKDIDCARYQASKENLSAPINGAAARTRTLMLATTLRQIEVEYEYNREYGRSVLTDFDVLCDKTLLKIPHVVFLIGLILGGLVLGALGDHTGRKMILLGCLWVTCVLSIFQLLGNDYISYAFFMLFIGITIGGVQVITVPYVMEMFPSDTRAIYGLVLLGSVFLLDLAIPWMAIGLKNWKVLQAIVTIPLIFTAALYWFTEESMFWYIAQKDHVTAILSLIRIAQFNGVTFETVFSDARFFLTKKSSKETQCDFQPLLRLEDVKTLSSKYPDFDMVDLETMNSKKNSVSQRFRRVITGRHLNPRSSIFYPTDFFHSNTLAVYLLIMCGLWLVSSLTEYSLDTPDITKYLTGHYLRDYFFTQLIQIISFVVAFPMIYQWGRRWPTFCFFLIAEVCLLGSLAVRLDNEQTRAGMVTVYFIGKFATRAAFLVIFIYTCELFPTGLRCTAVGICFTFRWIGIILASQNVGGLNDWMARLIYGILSLILGSLALLLPETRKTVLPRTMQQVEILPTSISETFRRRRFKQIQRQALTDAVPRPSTAAQLNDTASITSGLRLNRIGPYDLQSTLHSVYELQEFGQDDMMPSLMNRHAPRRMDSRNTIFNQTFSGGNTDSNRQRAIAEDAEYDEEMNSERKGRPLRQRQSEEVILAPARPISLDPSPGERRGIAILPDDTKDSLNADDVLSRSPRYRRTMSQDENYFSEHC